MIYLLRHGQTEFNRDRRMQGRLDSPLTELGVAQARRMGECLKPFVDDPARWSVVSSHLGRARQTAEIVRATLGLSCPLETDERLAEIHMGEWEGLQREEIPNVADKLAVHDWIFRSPGGETYDAVAARLSAWLAEVDERDSRRRVVVSHGAAGRVLRHLYAKGPVDQLWHDPFPPQDAVFLMHHGVVGRIDDHGD